MPWNRKDYPADWEAIVEAIRKRAGFRCEWPGCGARHMSVIARQKDGEPKRSNLDGHPFEYEDWECGAVTPELRFIRVVLTTAHTCQCEPKCGDPSHLSCLCQLHHNRLDGPMRRDHAAATRRKKQAAKGQLFLIGDDQ